MNSIHLFDQSIECEERAECGLYSKSFPMSVLNLRFLGKHPERRTRKNPRIYSDKKGAGQNVSLTLPR